MKIKNFLKLGVVFSAFAMTSCSPDPIPQAQPTQDPVVVDPVDPVPPQPSDTLTVFLRDVIVDQEANTANQLIIEQLDVDYATVPNADVLRANIAPSATATHEVKIVRDAATFASNTSATTLGGIRNIFGNPTYTNAQNHSNAHIGVHAYISCKNGSNVAQETYTDPTTGVTSTFNYKVLKIDSAEKVMTYTTGSTNPLNPGTSFTVDMTIVPSKNKLGQQGHVITITP